MGSFTEIPFAIALGSFVSTTGVLNALGSAELAGSVGELFMSAFGSLEPAN